MPNWVDQELAVFGPTKDIERFCALAVTGNFRRDHTLDDEPTFRFDLACPIAPGEAEACAEEHTAAVMFRYLRTQVFAHVEMQSSWDYPRHFYAVRMARDWPSLQFICAINEDMGSFGGLVARIGDEVIDLVADYEAPYDRRSHRRQMRKVQKRWAELVDADRPWRVELPLKFFQWLTYRADATLDITGTTLRFGNEVDVRRFVKGRKHAEVFKRSARTGKERKVAALCMGRRGRAPARPGLQASTAAPRDA